MMSDSLTKKTVNGSIWSIADVILRQGISFIISIVLARLLSPTDYGTIGMMMIFITISNVFVDSGFSSGLIRKIDRTEKDLCTAFVFNIIVGVGVYIVLFIFSPLIAGFFNNEKISILLRVLGLILIINSFNLVQNAILIYSMKVKQLALISAIAQISTGIISILLAYKGLGVWALIFQQLFSSVLQMILLSITTKWHPKLIFDRNSFRYLWSYGSRLLIANFIGSIFNQAYSFVIGKVLGQRDLGLYSRSDNFSQQPNGIVNNIINKALVPSLAECQNDLNRLRSNYIKCVEIISYVVFPLMFMLSFIARPLFIILFGSKWIDAIPLFQILCIGYSIDIFSTLSLQLIQVMGRTDYSLKLEFFKKPFYALIIFISISYGLKGIVIGRAIYCLIAALINLSVVRFLLKYNYLLQVLDIFKYAFATIVVMYPIYYLLSMLCYNNFFLLITFPLLSIGFYILASFAFKFKVLEYIRIIVKK